MKAALSYPIQAVRAADGSILIADEGNNVIRRVAPDGTIQTVAGIEAPARSAGRRTGHLRPPQPADGRLSDGRRRVPDRGQGQPPDPEGLPERGDHHRGRHGCRLREPPRRVRRRRPGDEGGVERA